MFLDAMFWPPDEVLVVAFDAFLLLDDEDELDDAIGMPRRFAAASAALFTSPLSWLVVAELNVSRTPDVAVSKKSFRSWSGDDPLDQSIPLGPVAEVDQSIPLGPIADTMTHLNPPVTRRLENPSLYSWARVVNKT